MPNQSQMFGPLSPVQEDISLREPLLKKNPLPLLRQSRVSQDQYGDRTESQESQDSHSSGETLVLPAVTVSLSPDGHRASPTRATRGSLSTGSSLQSQNSQDSVTLGNPWPTYSLQVPANRVRNALLVRGRRASVMHFANSNVVNSPSVSNFGEFIVWQRFCEPEEELHIVC